MDLRNTIYLRQGKITCQDLWAFQSELDIRATCVIHIRYMTWYVSVLGKGFELLNISVWKFDKSNRWNNSKIKIK